MMVRVRRVIIGVVIAVALIALIVATSGPPPPTPNPPGTFSFAVLGDAPYYWWEDLRFRLVLRALDGHDLAAVIHVGDIFWKPCSDAMYRTFRTRFDAIRHPVVYTPGDNEWTDCWERRSGGHVPLERLAALRRVFFADPTQSLGRRKIALTHQRGFVENARWQHDGIVFATVHLPGSEEGMKPFLDAATAWMRQTFEEARARRATAVVIAFHARHELFLAALREEAARFGGPVLITHGDEHEFIVDPLAPNLTRMEVPGSPDVGWVRVTVDPRATSPFTFENYVVPAWKWW